MTPVAHTVPPIRQENWRAGLAGSLLLHAMIFGVAAFWGFWNWGPQQRWGDPNANPGAGFAVTPVDRIPLPYRTARPNPKADDSEFDVDRAEPKDRDRDRQEKKAKDAIELNTDQTDRKEQKSTSRYKYRSSEELRRESLKSTVGKAASNPMYGSVGAGGVGVGTGTPFGSMFGWYADLLRRRISEKWRTSDVDPVIRTSRPAVVAFDIYRDGSVRNIKVVQSSGIPTLDYSARRAVMEAAPLPELPREFARESANVEFTFQLQR
jgi:protein TonB